MPSAPTRSTIARQWELLKGLPSSGQGKTTAELAQMLSDGGFDVSKRQVERDMLSLSEAFALDCNDETSPQRWRWVQGASADLPGLSSTEALSLRLVEETVRPLLPASLLQALEPRFEQAAKKLDSLDGTAVVNKWLTQVRSVPAYQTLLPPPILPAALANVQEALLADETVEVDYLGMGAKAASTYHLHPLALVVRGPVTYLVATASDYPDVRLYALHRIQRAARTYELRRKPVGFDLDAYIATGALQFGNGESLQIEAKISPYLARVLNETPLSADQRIEDDRLTATVLDTWQLKWWILGQGDGIEILQPAGLRTEIAEALNLAANQYHSG